MLYICARLLFCASEPSSWKSVNGEAEAPGVKGLKWLQLLLSFALSEDFTETKLQVLSFLSSRILSNSEWFSQFFFSGFNHFTKLRNIPLFEHFFDSNNQNTQLPIISKKAKALSRQALLTGTELLLC